MSGVESGGVSAYLGIPYAAPPVGDLRWRPPQPAKPWAGVRACTQYGASCIQGNAPDHPGKQSGAQSEDCLYLNVWTPAKTRHERLPVMVWIHGGGFISGSGALPAPGGTTLAGLEHVIVVSLNYRLGVFGFLAHSALSQESPHDVSGNYGLLDQMEALRWVRRNIAAFGGDPRRVMIFGQSAGGQSVIAQLVSPLSRGLFSRAASESPRYQDRGIGLWSTLTLKEQEQEGEELADDLGIPDGPGQAAALRECERRPPRRRDGSSASSATPDVRAAAAALVPAGHRRLRAARRALAAAPEREVGARAAAHRQQPGRVQHVALGAARASRATSVARGLAPARAVVHRAGLAGSRSDASLRRPPAASCRTPAA